MTVKEKARIAWERDLEVTVFTKGNNASYSGVIMVTDPAVIIMQRPMGSLTLCYSDIADIRFINASTAQSKIQDVKKDPPKIYVFRCSFCDKEYAAYAEALGRVLDIDCKCATRGEQLETTELIFQEIVTTVPERWSILEPYDKETDNESQ